MNAFPASATTTTTPPPTEKQDVKKLMTLGLHVVFMTLENVKKLICFIIVFIVGEQISASEKDDDVPYIKYAKEIMYGGPICLDNF